MAELTYKDTNQITSSFVREPHVFPKFGKSTTDPTFYEPAASRIANMKKASGLKLEGIYDFYSKDDVSKFNSENFDLNLRKAQVDPRFNNKLLPEEVSQVVNDLGDKAQTLLEDKVSKKAKTQEIIDTQVEASKQISKASQTSDSSDSE